MQLKKTIFREYDIRGLVGEEIDEDIMKLLGKAFGTYLLRKKIKKMVIGHDLRSYSEALKDAMVRGIISTGCHVTDIGLCMTPMLYFSQYHLGIKGAAMITASHNPNGYTGLKLCDDLSSSLAGKEIEEIYTLALSRNFESGTGTHVKKDIFNAYKKDLLGRIKLKREVKVVLDCGNGTASLFVPKLLKEAGCELIELFCDPDPSFPNHEPNPDLLEARKVISKKVREVKADIGILIDGDGDRLGVVDEKGENVWSDKVLALLSRDILKRKPGSKILFDVKSSNALVEDIKSHGGIPIFFRTGHSYIKKRIKKGDIVVLVAFGAGFTWGSVVLRW